MQAKAVARWNFICSRVESLAVLDDRFPTRRLEVSPELE